MRKKAVRGFAQRLLENGSGLTQVERVGNLATSGADAIKLLQGVAEPSNETPTFT